MSSSSTNTAHWSPVFQRLRTEVVFLSMIFLTVTQLHINLNKIPLIGLEIEGQISNAIIELFIFLFLVYYMISWVVRYLAERSDEMVAKESLDKLLANFTEILNSSKKMRLPSSRLFSNEVEELFSSLNEANDLSRIILSRNYEMRFKTTSDAKAGEREIRDNIESLVALGRRNQKLINDILESLSETRKEVVENYDRSSREILLYIHRSEVLINKIVHEISNYRSVMALDKKLLGFWIPLSFSLFSIAFCMPQFYIDTYSQISKAYNCVVEFESKCMYRDSQY